MYMRDNHLHTLTIEEILQCFLLWSLCCKTKLKLLRFKYRNLPAFFGFLIGLYLLFDAILVSSTDYFKRQSWKGFLTCFFSISCENSEAHKTSVSETLQELGKAYCLMRTYYTVFLLLL